MTTTVVVGRLQAPHSASTTPNRRRTKTNRRTTKPPGLPNRHSSDELPEALLNPPGLVGEIAGFITDSAIYPQPALSLGAALTIVGTAAGRRLAGPTRSGTHLYIIGLAPSGGGKDHPRAMIGVILAQAGMAACIGPSEFISMPAVYKFLNRAPLSVCAMDEFGAFLKRINSRKASGFEAQIGATLRTAWGSSFKPMPTPEWAGKNMGDDLRASAVDLRGVNATGNSTPASREPTSPTACSTVPADRNQGETAQSGCRPSIQRWFRPRSSPG